MSTRCQIAFYSQRPENNKELIGNAKTILYKHHDGYPEGILPVIKPFLVEWSKKRGLDDYEYASARLLQFLCNEQDKIEEGLNAKYEHRTSTQTLGLGICNVFHADIAFLYVVYPNALEVYIATGTDQFEKIETVPLAEIDD